LNDIYKLASWLSFSHSSSLSVQCQRCWIRLNWIEQSCILNQQFSYPLFCRFTWVIVKQIKLHEELMYGRKSEFTRIGGGNNREVRRNTETYEEVREVRRSTRRTQSTRRTKKYTSPLVPPTFSILSGILQSIIQFSHEL
jgi:hypothetical protein